MEYWGAFANRNCRGKAISITYLSMCLRARGRVRKCNISYPSCKSYPPYCDASCSPSVSNIFFREYLINDTIFGITLLNIKCVSWFSVQLLSQIFLIISSIQWDTVINMKTSSCKVPRDFCRILVKLEFSRQVFEKSLNIKCHQNLSSGSRVGPRGQMDMTKLIIAFRNFANAPKNNSVNAIQWNNRCLFSHPHKTHKYTVWAQRTAQ
jgi:hypothetical protein